MRTIWNGSINFGLVNIPIGLAVAQQRKDVSFRTLHRECGTPIKQKRWCPVHERDVEADELVKGWEFAKGQFVLVEESDLEAVALTRSQSIDIKRFVVAGRRRPDLLRPRLLPLTERRSRPAAPVRAPPARDAGGERRRDREVRPLGQGEPLPDPPARRGLALETLYYAEDIRSREEIDQAVAETEVEEPELEMARQLVVQHGRRVRPGGVRERVPRRAPGDARRQARGRGDHRCPRQPAPAPVIDLMEALKESVSQAQKTKASAAEEDACAEEARGVRFALGPTLGVWAVPARRPPRGAPGTGSCRSCPGRSGSTPR